MAPHLGIAHPHRPRLPLGLWILPDGSEIMFDAGKHAMLQRSPGQPAQPADPYIWPQPDWREERFFGAPRPSDLLSQALRNFIDGRPVRWALEDYDAEEETNDETKKTPGRRPGRCKDYGKKATRA
jgi:hypothetical protein